MGYIKIKLLDDTMVNVFVQHIVSIHEKDSSTHVITSDGHCYMTGIECDEIMNLVLRELESNMTFKVVTKSGEVL